MADRLTAVERHELDQSEATIELYSRQYLRVAECLVKIRDRRLYRETYTTFESYCQSRWGWSRQYAHMLMQTASAVRPLAAAGLRLPSNERVARELVRTPEPARAAAWQEALACSPQPTAGEVAAIRKRLERQEAERQLTAAEVEESVVRERMAELDDQSRRDGRREAIRAKRSALRRVVRVGGLDGGEQEQLEELLAPAVAFLEGLL